MTSLQSLLSRVESGSGADRAVDWELHVLDGLDGVGMYGAHPAYTTDLNAVVALVEARVGHDAAYMMLFAIMNEALFCVTEPIGPQLCRHMIAALIRAEMEKQT